MREITETVPQEIQKRNSHCDIISELYGQLIKLGVDIKSFTCDEHANINFIYTLHDRNVLNYEELESLQNIINPNIKSHDSIRIMGYKGEYNFYVNLCK
jgi:uncharacterized protein YacL